MRSLDIAKIVEQSLNNYSSIQKNYDNNLSNFSLCNIQEFGLGSVKSVLGKGISAVTSPIRNYGKAIKDEANIYKQNTAAGSFNPKYYNDLNVAGDHVLNNAGKYTAGILGSGAVGGGFVYKSTKDLYKKFNKDKDPPPTESQSQSQSKDIETPQPQPQPQPQPAVIDPLRPPPHPHDQHQLKDHMLPKEQTQHIPNVNDANNTDNSHESAKSLTSNIADHFKEHGGKYALGGLALIAGGLAARKYMKSRKGGKFALGAAALTAGIIAARNSAKSHKDNKKNMLGSGALTANGLEANKSTKPSKIGAGALTSDGLGSSQSTKSSKKGKNNGY